MDLAACQSQLLPSFTGGETQPQQLNFFVPSVGSWVFRIQLQLVTCSYLPGSITGLWLAQINGLKNSPEGSSCSATAWVCSTVVNSST